MFVSSEFVHRDSLMKRVKVTYDSNSVKLNAHADCGADVYTMLNTDTFMRLNRTMGLKRRRLTRPIQPKGFDGRKAPLLTHFVELTLTIDGRRQLKVPFIISKLGTGDVMLGRLWFVETGVLIGCKNRQFVWPNPGRLIVISLETGWNYVSCV